MLNKILLKIDRRQNVRRIQQEEVCLQASVYFLARS